MKKNNKQQLISIIIPIYKVEKYLRKCIDSILNQTYKNIEIILVDDGSPDKCGEICDEYALKDNRIKVIHKTNGGLSDARNSGVDIAKGKYIGFIDPDDYIEPTMYEKLYNALIDNNAEISVCSIDCVKEDGHIISECVVEEGVYTPEEICNKLSTDGNFYYVTTVNRLYSKDILMKIRFPKGKIHEDDFTVHRFYYECAKVVCISKILYHYVQRDGSITHNVFTIKRLDAVDALIDRYKFLKDKNINGALDSLITAKQILCKCIVKLDWEKYHIKFKKRYKYLMQELVENTNKECISLFNVYSKKYNSSMQASNKECK